MIGNKKKKLKGMGLMEMIISIGIFTLSILVITQIFLKINEGQRNIISAQNVQENIKYIFEVMSREIRNAVRDTSGGCIAIDKLYETDGASLSFINQNGDCVEYGIVDDINGISRLYIERGSNGQVYITPDDIEVDGVWFEINDSYQEKITIALDVRSIGKEIDSQAMKIQTTISSRLYDEASSPTIPAVCGDGMCNGSEDCLSCSVDCLCFSPETCGGGGVPGVCGETAPYCGDGNQDVGEECDDGNNIDGDGCSSICTIETSYCGDGNQDVGEECDDGNNIDGDGCSSICTIEITCGENIDYGGEIYPTVLIGTQCWMAKNLNVGSAIIGGVDQSDNGLIEKYCYGYLTSSDSQSNCDTYGGLYQWNEAMQYSTTEGSQGICPTGWHVPSDEEWKTLEMFLGMAQTEADYINWRGTNEGSAMAGNASLWTNGVLESNSRFGESGLNFLPAGDRTIDGSFLNINTDEFFWSSSLVFGSNTWIRLVSYAHTSVFRNEGSQALGFSVRCIKD